MVAKLPPNFRLSTSDFRLHIMSSFYQRQLARAREAAKNPNTKTTAFLRPVEKEEEQTSMIKKATDKASEIAENSDSDRTQEILKAFQQGKGSPTTFSLPSQPITTPTTTTTSNPQNKLFESLFKEYQPKLESYEPNSSNPFEYRSLF